mmetsp:Transcript_8696/g.19731  ORF Transcript_8696/g.19731 Transcript_8696/m.19731 type:complete len:204 (+) Transcript_8696:489-1100(+)
MGAAKTENRDFQGVEKVLGNLEESAFIPVRATRQLSSLQLVSPPQGHCAGQARSQQLGRQQSRDLCTQNHSSSPEKACPRTQDCTGHGELAGRHRCCHREGHDGRSSVSPSAMCADPREATSHVWDPGRVPRDRLAEAVGSGCDASEPPFSILPVLPDELECGREDKARLSKDHAEERVLQRTRQRRASLALQCRPRIRVLRS